MFRTLEPCSLCSSSSFLLLAPLFSGLHILDFCSGVYSERVLCTTNISPRRGSLLFTVHCSLFPIYYLLLTTYYLLLTTYYLLLSAFRSALCALCSVLCALSLCLTLHAFQICFKFDCQTVIMK